MIANSSTMLMNANDTSSFNQEDTTIDSQSVSLSGTSEKPLPQRFEESKGNDPDIHAKG